MPIGLEDLPNLASAITPSTDTIVERSKNWEKLFEKYSFVQTEEDGVDWEDFEKLNLQEEAEDDAIVFPDVEADEDNDSESEDNSKNLTHLQPEEKLSHHFTPELLNELKNVCRQNVAEMGKLNLPLWNYERQESSVSERTLSTTNFSVTARDIRNTHEKLSSPMYLEQRAADKINLNGTVQSNTDISSTIASLLAIGAGFSMKVREREYDIEVIGGGNGAIVKTQSEPNVTPSKSADKAKKPAKRALRASAQSKLPPENVVKPVATTSGAAANRKSNRKKNKKTNSKERSPRDQPASSSKSSGKARKRNDKTILASLDAIEESYETVKTPPALPTPEKVEPKVKQRKETRGNEEVMISIIISDSDESDDDFYLPKTPEGKTVKTPATKPTTSQAIDSSESDNHDSSESDDDDKFWLPKQSTIKKAPKSRSKDDECHSPKKIPKLKR